MVVTIKTTGGVFRSGRMNGPGEVYIEDEVTGEGECFIGNFVKGKLHDSDGIHVTYDNDSFIKHEGSFVNGVRSGTFSILKYEEKAGGGDRGSKHINNSKEKKKLNGRKRVVIFDNDVEITELSNVAKKMTISVTQKTFKDNKYFSQFSIQEA